MSTNYGLKGGTLDATEHLEAAAGKLCTQSELARWRADEIAGACRLVAPGSTVAGVAKARLN